MIKKPQLSLGFESETMAKLVYELLEKYNNQSHPNPIVQKWLDRYKQR
jgi:hypothetical protein